MPTPTSLWFSQRRLKRHSDISTTPTIIRNCHFACQGTQNNYYGANRSEQQSKDGRWLTQTMLLVPTKRKSDRGGMPTLQSWPKYRQKHRRNQPVILGAHLPFPLPNSMLPPHSVPYFPDPHFSITTFGPCLSVSYFVTSSLCPFTFGHDSVLQLGLEAHRDHQRQS